MYIKKIYDMGKVVDIEQYYPGNYGAPGQVRQKKQKATPEQIRKQNERNRAKKLKRIILANFNPGDWHLVLNYRPEERPENTEQAKKHIRKFIADMRRTYKKAGEVFKYIVVTEHGKKGGALHHHLIIQDMKTINTPQTVRKLWKYGNMRLTDLYENGAYEKLAEYIIKTETKDPASWATYSRSRNLIVPKPQRKKIHRRRWPEEPKTRKKGYKIIKDSIVNGFNPVTGYPFQSYSLQRIERRGRDHERGEPAKKRKRTATQKAGKARKY